MAEKQSYSSYQNPQIAVNRSFEMMAQQRRSSSATLQQLGKSIGEGIRAQKESQKKMQDDLNKFQQTQADRVADITEIGKSGFDANTNNYFQSQIDNYVQIKNGIESGDVDSVTGGKALAEINQRVAKYQQAAPIVIAEAQRILEAMKKPDGTPGAMYSQVPTDQQQMLIDLAGQSKSNGSNIHIVDLPTGGLALYNPENEAMINLDELINMEASGKEYFREVPDIKEDLATAANAIIGEKGSRVDGTVDIQTRNEGGRTITTESMTTDQYNTAVSNIMNGGGLGALIDDDDMDIIWNDVLGHDEPWNPQDEDKVNLAKLELAEKAIKDSGVGIEGREIQIGNTKYTAETKTIDPANENLQVVQSDILSILNTNDAAGVKAKNLKNYIHSIPKFNKTAMLTAGEYQKQLSQQLQGAKDAGDQEEVKQVKSEMDRAFNKGKNIIWYKTSAGMQVLVDVDMTDANTNNGINVLMDNIGGFLGYSRSQIKSNYYNPDTSTKKKKFNG